MSRIAGRVKTIPAAIDSPADPVVCTMLFSRMVERPSVRKNATESTAIGIEADTVRPIFSARYTLEAAKTRPSRAPRISARAVSSAGDWVGRTNGSWVWIGSTAGRVASVAMRRRASDGVATGCVQSVRTPGISPESTRPPSAPHRTLPSHGLPMWRAGDISGDHSHGASRGPTLLSWPSARLCRRAFRTDRSARQGFDEPVGSTRKPASIGLQSKGGRHAVDHLRDPARAVALGRGVVLHSGRLHPRAAGRRHRHRADPADPGAESRMKPAVIVGILLIIVGIAGLAYGGFSFTHKEKVLDLGPIEASADKKESLPVPPILGALAIVGGVVLVATSARRP